MEADHHYRTVTASLGNSPFKQGYERQDFSDLLLTTQSGGLILRCHRVIMAAFSAPLRKLFLKNPNTEEPVVVPNVDYNSLHYIVKLIYNGSVKIKKSEVESFAQAIRSLDMKLGDEVYRLAYEDDDTEDATPPQAKKRLLNKTITVTTIKSEQNTPKIDVFGLTSPSTSDGLSSACRPLASANHSFASSSQSLASGSHHLASVSLPSAPEPPPPVSRTISAPVRQPTGLIGTGLFRGREGARKYNDTNLVLEFCTSGAGEGRRRLIDRVNNRVVDNLRLSAAEPELQDQTMSSSQEESQHRIAAIPEYNPSVAPPALPQRGTKRPYGHNAVRRGAPNVRNPRGAPNRRGQPRPLMAARIGPPVNTVQMNPPVNASVSAPIAPREEIVLGPMGKFWLKVTNFERRREEYLMSVFRGSSIVKMDYSAGEAYVGFDEAAILRKNIQDYQKSKYNPEAKRVPDELLQFNGPSIRIIVENLTPLYRRHGPFEKLLKKNDIQFLPGTISLNGPTGEFDVANNDVSQRVVNTLDGNLGMSVRRK